MCVWFKSLWLSCALLCMVPEIIGFHVPLEGVRGIGETVVLTARVCFSKRYRLNSTKDEGAQSRVQEGGDTAPRLLPVELR